MFLFDKLGNIVQSGYDSTFGEMTGPQILWTIIGLLALYQLVMIKWRLIDQNRTNGVRSTFMSPWSPVFGRLRRFLQRRPSARVHELAQKADRTALDGFGFSNVRLRTANALTRFSGRTDLARAGFADDPGDFTATSSDFRSSRAADYPG